MSEAVTVHDLLQGLLRMQAFNLTVSISAGTRMFQRLQAWMSKDESGSLPQGLRLIRNEFLPENSYLITRRDGSQKLFMFDHDEL